MVLLALSSCASATHPGGIIQAGGPAAITGAYDISLF
jgi:hypothetical protein